MSEEDTPKPPPAWEQRTELGLNAKLREVVLLTQEATKAELDTLRRRLERLQRGG